LAAEGALVVAALRALIAGTQVHTWQEQYIAGSIEAQSTTGLVQEGIGGLGLLQLSEAQLAVGGSKQAACRVRVSFGGFGVVVCSTDFGIADVTDGFALSGSGFKAGIDAAELSVAAVRRAEASGEHLVLWCGVQKGAVRCGTVRCAARHSAKCKVQSAVQG